MPIGRVIEPIDYRMEAPLGRSPGLPSNATATGGRLPGQGGCHERRRTEQHHQQAGERGDQEAIPSDRRENGASSPAS